MAKTELSKLDKLKFSRYCSRLPSNLLTASGVKEFDRSFALPVPRSELDEAEQAFIRALRPRLNVMCNNDRIIDRDSGVLARFFPSEVHDA